MKGVPYSEMTVAIILLGLVCLFIVFFTTI
jgi:hypothetical protein